MDPVLPEYLWFLIVGAFVAFGFGWGNGTLDYRMLSWQPRTCKCCLNLLNKTADYAMGS